MKKEKGNTWILWSMGYNEVFKQYDCDFLIIFTLLNVISACIILLKLYWIVFLSKKKSGTYTTYANSNKHPVLIEETSWLISEN